MYLHLGGDVAVLQKSILGIFDLDSCSYSRITQEMLTKHEKKGRIVNVSDDVPRSFVICTEKDESVLYMSQISSVTLVKRAGANFLPDNLLDPSRRGRNL